MDEKIVSEYQRLLKDSLEKYGITERAILEVVAMAIKFETLFGIDANIVMNVLTDLIIDKVKQ